MLKHLVQKEMHLKHGFYILYTYANYRFYAFYMCILYLLYSPRQTIIIKYNEVSKFSYLDYTAVMKQVLHNGFLTEVDQSGGQLAWLYFISMEQSFKRLTEYESYALGDISHDSTELNKWL